MIKPDSVKRNILTLYIVLLLVICLVFGAIIMIGPVSISFSNIWNSFLGTNGISDIYIDIFWKIRFSKAVTALLAGSALGVSGLLMQTYFQNPLAGPFVLGIHGGSGLGVALWIMATSALTAILPPYILELGTIFFSFVGGISVLLLLMFLSLRIPGKVILLVVGLMLGFVSSGIINILVSVSEANEIKSFLLWSLGSFQRVSGSSLILYCSILIPVLALSILMIRPLNLLLLGDRYAKALGLSLQKTKYILIFLTAILAGTVTAFCGPIAFIGIIVPHIARYLFKSGDHKVILPATILVGGLVALIAEFIASSWEVLLLPLNAITGLLGAPIILIFLWRHRKEESF